MGSVGLAFQKKKQQQQRHNKVLAATISLSLLKVIGHALAQGLVLQRRNLWWLWPMVCRAHTFDSLFQINRWIFVFILSLNLSHILHSNACAQS